MIGDGRQYLSMIIALDAEEAPIWAAKHGVDVHRSRQLQPAP